MRSFSSHGPGNLDISRLKSIGTNVVFEDGVRAWHLDTISIGNNVYVGHNTHLKSYHKGSLAIGNDTWIGQEVFIHAAGGVKIGNKVGIGPRVSILTSTHKEAGRAIAILEAELEFAPIVIEDDSDIGMGAILLPGVTIGKGAQVGAGAVVTKDVEPYTVVAGNPARTLRTR